MPAGSQSEKRTRTCFRNGAASGAARERGSGICVIDRLILLKGFENAAGDDELLDFGGTFVNAQGADLAIKLLDNFAGGDALRAEDLHGGVDDLLCGFGGGHFGHGGFDGDAAALVAQPCGTIGEESGGVDGSSHLGELGLRDLKIGERLAEHFSGCRATQGFRKRAPRETEGGGGNGSAENVESGHSYFETLAGCAETL